MAVSLIFLGYENQSLVVILLFSVELFQTIPDSEIVETERSLKNRWFLASVYIQLGASIPWRE